MAKNKRMEIWIRKVALWDNIPPYCEMEVILPDYPGRLYAFLPESQAMGAIVKLLKYNAKLAKRYK
jgi:hypothetical protein